MTGLKIPGDWTDWKWGGQAINPPGAISAATFSEIGSTGTYAYEFSNNNAMAFHDLQIGHNYKEGTDIRPHIHFLSDAAGTYTGTWTMTWTELLEAGPNQTLQGPFTATAAFNEVLGAKESFTMEFSTLMSGTGRKISSLANIALSLSLSSGGSVFLMGFDGHYQMDRIGSTDIFTK